MTRRELMTTDKKIRKTIWVNNRYIYFCTFTDDWVNEKGLKVVRPTFDNPSYWEYYIEPPPKKQITFYEYLVESIDPIKSLRLVWSNMPPEKVKGKHTGTTKTVEVEE